MSKVPRRRNAAASYSNSDLRQLLQQVTRIADALELQQEFNLEQLRQRHSAMNSRNINQQIDTCTALIMAANKTGQAMKTVDEAVSSGRAPENPEAVERDVDAFAAIEQARRLELAAAVNDFLKTPPRASNDGGAATAAADAARSLAPFTHASRHAQLDDIISGRALGERRQ